jgi:hypothetical protein
MKGIRETEQGTYDGMPMLNSRSSEKIVLSEEPCGILIQIFYVKKGDPWKYDGLQSLENINVGSVSGALLAAGQQLVANVSRIDPFDIDLNVD